MANLKSWLEKGGNRNCRLNSGQRFFAFCSSVGLSILWEAYGPTASALMNRSQQSTASTVGPHSDQRSA